MRSGRPEVPARHTGRGRGPSLDEFFSRVYLPHARARKRSWRVDERIARQYLSPAFGSCAMTAISRCQVEDWLNGLPGLGLAPATCNRILAVMRALCSLAQSRGLIASSPCQGVRRLRVTGGRGRNLSLADAGRLLRALESSQRPEALALRLLLLTGARKSEILKARWDQLRLEDRLLVVPVSKSGRPRHIFLSDAAIMVIRALPRKAGSPWLFPGHTDSSRPISDIYLFWNRLRRELGMADVRVHDLRHTFASVLVNAGHSLFEAQLILGHADPRTTMRYAHLGRSTLLLAAEAVARALSWRLPPRNRQRPRAQRC